VAICKKISNVGGSSDIIRHEQGRFNRWQKKVKPPCSKNPQIEAILSRYQTQKSSTCTKINRDEQNESESQQISTTSRISVEQHPNNLDNYKSFDSEFNSILQSMEKDNLNFSDVDTNDLKEVTSAIDRNNYDGSIPPLANIRSNDVNSNQSMNGIEPANKRVKITSKQDNDGTNACPKGEINNDASEEQIDQLCNEVIEKCLLGDFENC
jgi:hypothetical protein